MPNAPTPDPDHTCHADFCDTKCDPDKLMCPRHWRMVAPALKNKVWRMYEPGQEITKTPSLAYLVAAEEAICDVAVKEGRITKANAFARIEGVRKIRDGAA